MAEYYDPETYPKEWNYLQSGTIIDQYMIERELVHGGFSSVYVARQLADQIQVAVKEYLPRKLAHRTWNNVVVANSDESKLLFNRGRALFVEEAKVLAKLKHPNIVEVINFFQENSTVYIVMPYYYGITLDKLLKEKNVPITESFLTEIFRALLDGIDAIHRQNLVHLDIKPANILIRPANNPLLLDFGAAQPYPVQRKNIKSKVLTKGFSPIEQHKDQGEIGPWTDIYAVGASMRACLDGRKPVSAPEREQKDTLVPAVKAYQGKYSEQFLQAMDWAMSIQPDNRPQTIMEFKESFNP